MKYYLVLLALAFPAALCRSLPVGMDLLIATPRLDPVTDREYLGNVIVRAYDGNVRNTLRILQFIERFPFHEQRMVSYRLLFDEMLRNRDLYSMELMTLAYRVHICMNHKDHTTNLDIMSIRERLPKSVANFPWDKTLRIRNKRFEEYIYSPINDYMKDTTRRPIFSWMKKDCDGDSCLFKIRSKDGELFGVQLMNPEKNEMLYAERTDMLYDNYRRSVYYAKDSDIRTTDSDTWMFEPIEDSEGFRIYNTFYGEYLYLPVDSYKYDDSRRNIFTWRRLGCDNDQCEFFMLPTE